MRSIIRSGLVAILGFGMLNLPAFGAGAEPLGVVIQTQDAHLSNANAQIGATVYPGDAITTEQDGTIRLRIGSGQLYLAPSSSASLTQNAKSRTLTFLAALSGLFPSRPRRLNWKPRWAWFARRMASAHRDK